MRRTADRFTAIFLTGACAFFLSVSPAPAQEKPINPRIPPPPPPSEQPAAPPHTERSQDSTADAPAVAPKTAALPELVPPPNLPARIVIPAGTRISVVLDTPLSTRIARQGQIVTFRTSEPLPVGSQLAIPPETVITGSVVELRKPGHFGKQGKLRVKVDRIELPGGASANLLARVDSADLDGQGRMATDNNRATDLYSLIMYSAQGTLLGAQIKGGKGAAVGAGAGAAVALLILMSRRGRDVYLEPGMPFQVVLDRDASLPGKDVFAAQAGYARSHTDATSAGGEPAAVSDPSVSDPGRPVLKRRPRKPKN